MSDKQYAEAMGLVQQFGKDKPAIEAKQLNDGQTVHRFTIKTSSGALIGVTLFPELAHAAQYIQRGAMVGVNGTYSSNVGQNGTTYHSIAASTLSIAPAIQRQERAVVNQQPQAAAPVATDPVQAAAPVAQAAPGSSLTF